MSHGWVRVQNFLLLACISTGILLAYQNCGKMKIKYGDLDTLELGSGVGADGANAPLTCDYPGSARLFSLTDGITKVCKSMELRLCREDGTLTGSYPERTCSIPISGYAPQPCTSPVNSYQIDHGSAFMLFPNPNKCQADILSCQNGNLQNTSVAIYSSFCNEFGLTLEPSITCDWHGGKVPMNALVIGFNKDSYAGGYDQPCGQMTARCGSDGKFTAMIFPACRKKDISEMADDQVLVKHFNNSKDLILQFKNPGTHGASCQFQYQRGTTWLNLGASNSSCGTSGIVSLSIDLATLLNVNNPWPETVDGAKALKLRVSFPGSTDTPVVVPEPVGCNVMATSEVAGNIYDENCDGVWAP